MLQFAGIQISRVCVISCYAFISLLTIMHDRITSLYCYFLFMSSFLYDNRISVIHVTESYSESSSLEISSSFDDRKRIWSAIIFAHLVVPYPPLNTFDKSPSLPNHVNSITLGLYSLWMTLDLLPLSDYTN